MTEQKNKTHCLVHLIGNIRLRFPSEHKSCYTCTFQFSGFALDATIEQAVSYKIREGSLGNAQVTRKVLGTDCMNEPKVNASFIVAYGRADVVNTINDFIFTPASKSAFKNFTIVDDDVLEFDELFIAEFKFDPKIANTWNAIDEEPSTALILIRDDDCELFSDYAMTPQTQAIHSLAIPCRFPDGNSLTFCPSS